MELLLLNLNYRHYGTIDVGLDVLDVLIDKVLLCLERSRSLFWCLNLGQNIH